MPDSPPPVAPPRRSPEATGLLYALAAYLTWGLAPVYFKAIRAAGALEIAAHRVVWSMLLLAVLIGLGRRWGEVRAALSSARRLGVYATTTLLISANWLVFIWAVNANRLLEASLGYFINPLVNVVLGVLFLGERLTARQSAAVGLAALGVAVQVVRLGQLPLVSLVLALTFGLYALVRKKAQVDPVVGLFVETGLLAPLSLGFLAWLAARGQGHFGAGGGLTLTLLLAAAGVVTASPLVWFQHGAKRLRLATLGLMQYLAPTCQFLLAVLAFRETFTATHAITFGCIWMSLVLYSLDALAQLRRTQRALEAARG